MNRRFIITTVLAIMASTMSFAQKSDVLSVGARVGMASFMQKSNDFEWKVGFNTLADFRYAHYFGTLDSRGSQWGIATGLSLGYTQSSIEASVNEQFRTTDMYGMNILYTITSDKVKESDRQLSLEIPVMASFTYWHMYTDVGLKIGIPVYSQYKQTISNIDIDAYYEDLDVHVTNEVVTGIASDEDFVKTRKWNGANINLMLTAEVGYLFELKNGNSIGVGVYADYTFWNNFKNESPSLLVDVETATINPGDATPASVHVTNLTDAYVDKLGYFDFGVKVAYNFSLKK